MKIHASVSTVPIQVHLDLPDATPVGEIRDRIIEQARILLANNGSEHVVLASDMPELVDSMAYLEDLGFPVLTEYAEVEPPEPDWNELAQLGITRNFARNPEDDQFGSDMPDFPD